MGKIAAVERKRRYRVRFLSWIAAVTLLAVAGWLAAGGGAAATSRPADAGATGIFEMKRWSPYVVGIGIGILSWIAFVLSDHPIGVSTAYAQTAGMVEKAVFGKRIEEKEYYRKYVPRVGWTWMLVVGIVIGAFVSARLSGDFRPERVPPLWEARFGHTPILRWAAALVGGVILGIGARWADGCTSGHGISGTLQLVVGSWTAVICFFIGGAATALLIFP